MAELPFTDQLHFLLDHLPGFEMVSMSYRRRLIAELWRMFMATKTKTTEATAADVLGCEFYELEAVGARWVCSRMGLFQSLERHFLTFRYRSHCIRLGCARASSGARMTA